MFVPKDALMDAVCDVALTYGAPLFGMAGTAHARVAELRGSPFVAEFDVDLEYDAPGGLIIGRRAQPTSVERAVKRLPLAIEEGVAIADTGERFPMRFDSVCVHSDTPGPVSVALAIREVLNVRSMSSRKEPVNV
jgi:UPF0271 protein